LADLSADHYPIALPLIVAAVVATVVSRALGWDITLEGRQLR